MTAGRPATNSSSEEKTPPVMPCSTISRTAPRSSAATGRSAGHGLGEDEPKRLARLYGIRQGLSAAEQRDRQPDLAGVGDLSSVHVRRHGRPVVVGLRRGEDQPPGSPARDLDRLQDAFALGEAPEITPSQPDWSRILTPTPYDDEEVSHASGQEPDWFNLGPSYAQALNNIRVSLGKIHGLLPILLDAFGE